MAHAEATTGTASRLSQLAKKSRRSISQPFNFLIHRSVE
jgi:hypothetical protein